MSEPSRSERIASELRDAPPRVDEIARARAEKRLVDAVASGVGGALPVPAKKRPMVAIAAGAAFLAAAAVLLFVLLPRDGGATQPAPVASFEALDPGAPVRRGTFAPGETVETSASQRVRVRIDRSEVLVAPGTRVRFSAISEREVRLTVERGRVDVGFHPRRRGEQRMHVLTRTARVDVVGTVFHVTVDERGETSVGVSEGTVRVVDLREQTASLVHAGGSLRVALAVLPLPPPVVQSAQRVAEPAPQTVPAAPAAAVATAPDRAPRESSPAERLGAARAMITRDPDRARTELNALASDPRAPAVVHAGALMDLGNMARTAGRFTQAEGHYAVAARAARGSADEANALYSLGEIRERQLDDAAGAREAYARALAAPGAAVLRRQLQNALCRLGDSAHCDQQQEAP